IFNSNDTQLIHDYVMWLDQKETLARLYAYSKEELNTQRINLDSIEHAANAMEKKLSERSADFSAGFSSAQLTYKSIQNLLNETEVVVEIIRIQKYDQKFTDDVYYAALVLTKNGEEPELIELKSGQ